MQTAAPEQVIQTTDTSKPAIARALFAHLSAQGHCPILRMGPGDFIHWDGTQWSHLSFRGLEELVHQLLLSHPLQFAVTTSNSGTRVDTVRYDITAGKRRDIALNLQALLPSLRAFPCWQPPVPLNSPHPARVVAFRNLLIDVDATAARFRAAGTYDWVTLPKTPSWVGTPNLTLDFDPAATCPVWERSCLEWANHEGPPWVELLERMFGACISAFRDWGVFFVQYGVARSGKGTSTRVLRHIVGDTFRGAQLSMVLGDRQSVSARHADVTFIPEVPDLDWQNRNRLAEWLRITVGRDSTEVNEKYGDIQSNVTYHTIPILQTHNLLRLPNEQGGIVTKMVPLRYFKSFAAEPNHNLENELVAELPGIALRLLKALIRLAAADPKDRWPLTQGTIELKHRIELESNPIDAFLNWGFVKNEKSWLPGDTIHKLRTGFENANDTKLCRRDGTYIPPKQLLVELEELSSWGVRRRKDKWTDEDGYRTEAWGLQGISIKHPSLRGQ